MPYNIFSILILNSFLDSYSSITHPDVSTPKALCAPIAQTIRPDSD